MITARMVILESAFESQSFSGLWRWFYPVCLSDDGNELYLVKRNPDNSDIYVAYRADGIWSKAIPLNRHINSKADETSAGISSDRQMLWFTSARKGGSGDWIFISHNGCRWRMGRARNAGKVINTQFDEESPSPVNNGKALFFSSKGHYSMGGYDIFYATQQGKTWNDPVNIGYPVNNTTDNFGFVPLDDGISGYYSRSIFPRNSWRYLQVTLKSMIQFHDQADVEIILRAPEPSILMCFTIGRMIRRSGT